MFLLLKVKCHYQMFKETQKENHVFPVEFAFSIIIMFLHFNPGICKQKTCIHLLHVILCKWCFNWQTVCVYVPHTQYIYLVSVRQEMLAFLCAPFLCQWRAELHFWNSIRQSWLKCNENSSPANVVDIEYSSSTFPKGYTAVTGNNSSRSD